ncbi:hypothetical protein GQ816_001415 [Salmonella enterica]|nr:hypothetical protein [Salmonella enterica subsp. enterica serovar Kentucky]
MWLVVNILLRYCLFLRSAPHRSEAKILHCTVQVLPMIRFWCDQVAQAARTGLPCLTKQ